MAYDDKKTGTVFPTRHGTPTGTANERRMLDVVEGSQGIRTRVQKNPDGSETILRTRAGMPEFTTRKSTGSGGGIMPEIELSCRLFMDSGVVDLHAGTQSDPNLAIDANVYATPFLTANLGGRTGIGAGTMRINVDPAGKLIYKIPGTLPDDGAVARSFSSEIGSVEEKKVAAWHVPSSMFTGRMRLYVQALYGSVNKTILLSKGDSPRPTLKITTKSREDAGAPPITVGTGTGLYYDKNDHSHWLIFPGTTSALIVKMRTNFCAERLRTQLSKTTYSDAEKERIEAYILAHAIPDLEGTQVQEVFYDYTPTDSMGYSWHFNWDGDTCDIVDVVETLVRPGAYGFKSTHYRLKFVRNTDGTFAVIRTIEAGPSYWSVPKNINVIAYPDWGSNRLVKAGNLPSGISDTNQNGLVYCFYRGNDLQLVSYTGVTTSHDAFRTSSPQYFGGLYWASNANLLLNGGESGATNGSAAWTGMRHEFSCGSVTVGGENGSTTSDEKYGTWLGRTAVGSSPIGTNQVTGTPATLYTGMPNPVSGVVYNPSGEPIATDPASYSSSVSVGVGRYWRTYDYYDGYTINTKSYTETHGAFSLIVIPFMDAQAVYMQGSTRVNKSGTDRNGTRHVPKDTTYGRFQYETAPGVWSGTFDKFFPVELNSGGAASGEPADVTSPLDETTITDQGCKLICAHGIFSASPGDVDTFYSALDYVEQSWGTITSVNGVVVSESNGIYSGSTIYPFYSSLVGWS